MALKERGRGKRCHGPLGRQRHLVVPRPAHAAVQRRERHQGNGAHAVRVGRERHRNGIVIPHHLSGRIPHSGTGRQCHGLALPDVLEVLVQHDHAAIAQRHRQNGIDKRRAAHPGHLSAKIDRHERGAIRRIRPGNRAICSNPLTSGNVQPGCLAPLPQRKQPRLPISGKRPCGLFQHRRRHRHRPRHHAHRSRAGIPPPRRIALRESRLRIRQRGIPRASALRSRPALTRTPRTARQGHQPGRRDQPQRFTPRNRHRISHVSPLLFHVSGTERTSPPRASLGSVAVQPARFLSELRKRQSRFQSRKAECRVNGDRPEGCTGRARGQSGPSEPTSRSRRRRAATRTPRCTRRQWRRQTRPPRRWS